MTAETLALRGPTVVLVGRPNVGKSTLFNRITGPAAPSSRRSPGTTRDVDRQPAEWQGTPFTLVDTGGLFGASEDPLHELVVAARPAGARIADVIVFVVDGREGLVPGDEEIAAALRAANVPVAPGRQQDGRQARARTGRSSSTGSGFEPVVEIAAEHGQGIGDCSTRSSAAARPRATPSSAAAEPTPDEIAVAIVGRPERRQVVAGQSVAPRGARRW